MDLVKMLEAFRERCAEEVADWSGLIREIDVTAWLASQPALDVGLLVCVAALVTDPLGRVLLVRSRRREGWEMPGGKKRPGESWRVAVAREVLEETGIQFSILSHTEIEAGPADGLSCESLIFISFCSATTSEPKVGGDARWFATDALPELADLPTARILREWAGAW